MGTLFCVKPENNYILKLCFTKHFFLTGHTGAIYLKIQNEHCALNTYETRKDHKAVFTCGTEESTYRLIHYPFIHQQLGRNGLNFKQGGFKLDINKMS